MKKPMMVRGRVRQWLVRRCARRFNIMNQMDFESLVRLVSAAVRQEREECAEDCERGEGANSHGRFFAERIRARGKGGR